MNSHTEKSAVARCSLITANTATATNAAFSDFPYLTSLRKRANITHITTISNFSNLDKVQKARFFCVPPRRGRVF
jgi:hypothetical protein